MNKRILSILSILMFLAACASPSGPELVAKKIEDKE